MTNDSSTLQNGASALQDADAAIAGAVIPVQDHPGIRLVGELSEIADQPQMRILCAGVIGAGFVASNPRLARAGLRMLLAHELATAAKSFVKHHVDRTRPRSLGDGEAPHLKAGNSRDKEESSFPSGHSAGAAATSRAFAREYPGAAPAIYAAAGLVALAQIPRCAHYPTDVGAGVAIGIAAEAAVNWTFERLVPA